jgi:hypothetical protein
VAIASASAMKELRAAAAGSEDHMLEIGCDGRKRPDRRDIEETALPRQGPDRGHAGQVVDRVRGVTVRNLVARDMQ